MYRVTITNGSTEIEIHNENVNTLKLETGVIKTAINAVNSFDLKMYMNNPGYSKMKPFTTLIKVLNTQTGVYEFEGRVLSPSETMEENGLHSTAFICEGELGYLHDSQQRHLEFRGTPRDLLNTILSYHNNQVEAYKQFQIGTVTATNSTDNVYVYLSGEQNTFETIKDKLLDRVGGELQIRKVGGVRYLDYLTKVGEEKQTEIRLAKNLISLSRDIDPTEVITRLTPLGARIESEDETATDASEARLTVVSVNSGSPYIDRPDLIATFGIQGGSMTWDDVNTEARLLSNAVSFMANQKISLNQYNVSAVDLSIIGLDIDDFKKGDSYKVINPIMGIDEVLRVIGTSKDINSPQDGTLTIGDKFKSLYQYQNDARKSSEAINELQHRVDRVTTANGNLNAQLSKAQDDLNKIKGDLIDIDVDNLPEELREITRLLVALKDDLDKLEIPVYGVATTAKDGLMSSADKAKLNGLKKYDVVTKLEDGLMSSLDKLAHDELVITVADLVRRFDELESGEPIA